MPIRRCGFLDGLANFEGLLWHGAMLYRKSAAAMQIVAV